MPYHALSRKVVGEISFMEQFQTERGTAPKPGQIVQVQLRGRIVRILLRLTR